MKISRRLSKLDDKTAIDPEANPAVSLLKARTTADAIAKIEALYFMFTHYSLRIKG